MYVVDESVSELCRRSCGNGPYISCFGPSPIIPRGERARAKQAAARVPARGSRRARGRSSAVEFNCWSFSQTRSHAERPWRRQNAEDAVNYSLSPPPLRQRRKGNQGWLRKHICMGGRVFVCAGVFVGVFLRVGAGGGGRRSTQSKSGATVSQWLVCLHAARHEGRRRGVGVVQRRP